jgi:hypothetical protein
MYRRNKSVPHLATIIVLITCGVASQAGCQEKPLASTGMSCRRETDCQSDLSCAISPGQDWGLCIPKAYASSADDEGECLYRATCAAAEALPKVCPACTLSPALTCSSVTLGINTPWQKMMRSREERLESTCLKLRPEQIGKASTDPEELRARRRIAEAWGNIPVEINGWSVHLPLSWQSDYVHYMERSRQLSNALKDVAAFRPPCELAMTLGTTTTVTAGQCGGFRNPDPSKPPPRVTIRPRKTR